VNPSVSPSGPMVYPAFRHALGFETDTNTTTSEFIQIPNDRCYYTLEINKGVYTPIPDKLVGKTIRLRIKVQSTDTAELKQIIADVKTKFNIDEYTIQKIKLLNSAI
jgi:hypothetical protein